MGYAPKHAQFNFSSVSFTVSCNIPGREVGDGERQDTSNMVDEDDTVMSNCIHKKLKSNSTAMCKNETMWFINDSCEGIFSFSACFR